MIANERAEGDIDHAVHQQQARPAALAARLEAGCLDPDGRKPVAEMVAEIERVQMVLVIAGAIRDYIESVRRGIDHRGPGDA
jgi:hypothetical protein